MCRRAAASGSASKLLTAGRLPGVDQRLTSPAIESLDRDAELVGEILDGLASEHPLTGFMSDLGGVVPWHIWLLLIRAKSSYRLSTFGVKVRFRAPVSSDFTVPRGFYRPFHCLLDPLPIVPCG